MTDSQMLSNHFNKYFVSVGKDLASTLPRSDTDPLSYLSHNHREFLPSDTSPEEITAIINSLKESAPGFDNIYTKALKKTAPVLAPVISKKINKFFQTGIFPERLKTAKIIPVYIGWKADNIINYRPISILPCVSKIYERAMYSRFIEFLDNNHILTKCQFGFRKKTFLQS